MGTPSNCNMGELDNPHHKTAGLEKTKGETDKRDKYGRRKRKVKLAL